MSEKNTSKRSLHKTSTKGKKGIHFGIPLFLLICGSLIMLFAGWNLFKQTYLITKFFFHKTSVDISGKKFVVNNVSVSKPSNDSQIGTIEIPSISINYPVIHGYDDTALSRGVEHDSTTPMPGENNNPVLAGHRDTVFSKLGDVKVGDKVTLNLYYGTFTYKVSNIRIVDANDTTVKVSSNKEMLTIYTCYPFNYIGSAPKRYILTCDFVSSNMKKELKVEGK